MPTTHPAILIHYPIGTRTRLPQHTLHGIRDGSGLDIIYPRKLQKPSWPPRIGHPRAFHCTISRHTLPSAFGPPGLHRVFSPGPRGTWRTTRDGRLTDDISFSSSSIASSAAAVRSSTAPPPSYPRPPPLYLSSVSSHLVVIVFSRNSLFGIPFPLSRHLGCIKGKADCTLGYYSPSAKTRRRDLGLTRDLWVNLCIICGRPVAHCCRRVVRQDGAATQRASRCFFRLLSRLGLCVFIMLARGRAMWSPLSRSRRRHRSRLRLLVGLPEPGRRHPDNHHHYHHTGPA